MNTIASKLSARETAANRFFAISTHIPSDAATPQAAEALDDSTDGLAIREKAVTGVLRKILERAEPGHHGGLND